MTPFLGLGSLLLFMRGVELGQLGLNLPRLFREGYSYVMRQSRQTTDIPYYVRPSYADNSRRILSISPIP